MAYTDPQIAGWMDAAELAWLYDMATQMNSIVEIGSWKGRSTHALLTGCRGPVFAVDHFKGSPNELEGAHAEAKDHDIYPEFYKNVGHFPNLVTMRMDSVAASKFFRPGSIDMVFIDGCHAPHAVMVDILAWLSIRRVIMCGHDLSSVKEVLSNMRLNYKQEPRSLWSIMA